MQSTHLIYEGDRLFSLNNLNKLSQLYDLRIVMLENDNDILAIRHKERNDTQSDKFLKGRTTKMQRIKEYFKEKVELHSLKNLKDDELLEALQDSREEIIDFAETKLIELIRNGNASAIFFYLKTVGKDRGYIEKQEIDQNNRTVNIIEVPAIDALEPTIDDIKSENEH